MKFKSILRRALKPHIKGRKYYYYTATNPGMYGCSSGWYWTEKDEEATHVAINVDFEWHTRYGAEWYDSDTETYKVYAIIVPIGKDGPEIRVETEFSMANSDAEHDRIYHKVN